MTIGTSSWKATGIAGYGDVDVFVGVDVGEGEHHAVAIDRAGKRLFNKAPPHNEGHLKQLFARLKARGRVLLVVDQPAPIGALPVAVAHAKASWSATRLSLRCVGSQPSIVVRRRPTPATR